MGDCVVNMVRRNLEIEGGIGILQSLSLLELAAMGNANSRIWKNENTPLYRKAISQIGESKMEVFRRGVPKMRQSRKMKEVIGGIGSSEERNKNLGEWGKSEWHNL